MADEVKAIQGVPVASRNLCQWGVGFNEYDYTNPAPVAGVSPAVYEGIDFEKLTIKISNRRAVVIESEVAPMAIRMTKRNTELDWLGQALSDLSAFSADYTANEDGVINTVTEQPLTADGLRGLALINRKEQAIAKPSEKKSGYYVLTKNQVDPWTQELKTAMDSRNNKSSQDMTRLQSLVDRRDDAYSTSSSLSDKISGTRSNTIKNMV